MEMQVCVHCGVRVMPSSEGVCPSCRKSMTDVPVGSALEAAGQDQASNPYAAPVQPVPPRAASASKRKEPFSHQAAKFSAYAPFILLLMGFCVQGQLEAHRGTETGVQLGMALAGVSIFTALAAFALGFVGLVGGFTRRAVWTIVLAIVGILLNGGILTLWATTLLAIFSRPA